MYRITFVPTKKTCHSQRKGEQLETAPGSSYRSCTFLPSRRASCIRQSCGAAKRSKSRRDVGLSIAMGVPQNRWFIETAGKKWMMTGGYPSH